jgi:hypothetical protein
LKYLLLPLLLALCSPCWGADYIKSGLITAPDSVPVGSTIVVQIQGDLPYEILPKPTALIRLRDDDGNRVLLIQGAVSPGYEISVDYHVVHPTEEELAKSPTVPDPKDEAQVKVFKDYLRKHSSDEFFKDSHTVKVGKGPDPGPDPEPDPDVKPPIPEPGFRVLMLYETEMKEKLPVLQKAVLFGVEVRNYLDKTCVSESDGGKAYRIYDKDQDASGDYPVWKTAMERRPESIPWLIVSNGKTGYEGPLPESPTAFLELCKKYEVK